LFASPATFGCVSVALPMRLYFDKYHYYHFSIRCNFGNEKHSYSPINRFIKSKIDEYQVKCKFSGQGCLKLLKISAIEKHEEICEFSKAKAKQQPILGNASQFNSTNCPTSNYKCPTCKKQMIMTEVIKK